MKTKYMISYVVIWYMTTFQLPVNTNRGRTITLPLWLCWDTEETLQSSYVNLPLPTNLLHATLGGSARRASTSFIFCRVSFFLVALNSLRGELDSRKEINGNRLDKLAPFLKRFMFLSLYLGIVFRQGLFLEAMLQCFSLSRYCPTGS